VNGNLVALVAGTVLAVGALAFVLYPLFFAVDARASSPRRVAPTQDSAIQALREIEFDRATGKLSDSDYQALRKTYGDRALGEMRATAVTAPPVEMDPVEARVRAYLEAHRECATCGLRPEVDAIYCSNCGLYLDARCPACSARITEAGAAYCSSCGVPLAPNR
jgi:hypothetical protein